MSVKRVGLVSLHTSPLEAPGSGDAGGLNVYVVALAEQLAGLGLEVELLTRASNPDHPATGYTPGGVPVRHLRAGPEAPVPKGELVRHLSAFRDALLALAPYDVLHSHYWLSGGASSSVAGQQGIPHIQSLHTVAALKNEHLAPGDAPESGERLRAERRLVRESAATIASTVEERAAIIHSYGAAPGRVPVIPPGVDARLFHPAEPNRSGRPGILTLGRIQPLKGQDLAIRALAAIPAEHRPLLTIAGAATPGQEQFERSLRTLAGELGVEHDVVFVGTLAREEAARLLREAALVLIPSHSETFGLVALEAAASGTPVIASQQTGTGSSVSHLSTGILLPSRDPALWGRTVDELLGDPGRLGALSASAAEHATLHTWKRSAELTLAVYEHAVGEAARLRGRARAGGRHPVES